MKDEHRASSPRDRAPALDEIAADWVIRRQEGLTPVERQQLEAWLAGDERHAAAFGEFESAWTGFNAVRREGGAGAVLRQLDLRERSRARRRGIYSLTAVALAAAAVVVFALDPRIALLSRAPTAPTAAIKPDRRVLPDGTVVELNAGADINVAYTARQRAVTLVRGEALFAVAKDALHPFVVSAANVRVRAVGTAFAVSFDPRQIGVLVTEGRVAVERTADDASGARPAAPTYLGAGNQAAVPTEAADTMPIEVRAETPAEMAASLAWRTQRLEFSDTTVGEAIRLFNRQNRVQIRLADDALAHRRITGIFWANDPAGFARLLQSGLGLKAAASGDVIVLSPL